MYPAFRGDVHWRISRACEGGACVGVAQQGEFVLVGNAGSPGGPVYRFTRNGWLQFLAGVKLGEIGSSD